MPARVTGRPRRIRLYSNPIEGSSNGDWDVSRLGGRWGMTQWPFRVAGLGRCTGPGPDRRDGVPQRRSSAKIILINQVGYPLRSPGWLWGGETGTLPASVGRQMRRVELVD